MTVESDTDWIGITSASSSRNGRVSFTVAPNKSMAPPRGRMSKGGRSFTVEESGLLVRINSAVVSGKNLIVTSEKFDPGGDNMLNGEEQKSRTDDENPHTRLIGKKAGRKIKAGDRLQVRNPDGSTSEEFIFTGS